MMTDEQLIARIRTALHDEADELLPVPELLGRLRATPTTDAGAGRWMPGRIGGAAAVLASAAVVALVVIVIGALGHGGTAPRAGSGLPAGTPRTARALVARIALLRRPQTAADRLPAAIALGGRDLDQVFDPSLTRLATTVDVGGGPLAAVRVYVILDTGKAPTGSFAGVRVGLFSGPPNSRLLGLSGDMAPNAGAAFARPSSVPAFVGPGNGRTRVWLSVVPDGVARARWVFTRLPIGTGPDVTVSPRIENNVAISTVAPGGELVSATWYGASGRVLSSVSDAAQIDRLKASVTRLLYRSAHEPIAQALIEHFVVFRKPTPPPATITPVPAYARASLAGNPQMLNIDQARFIPYPGTPGFWVIPGRSGAAMATTAGGSGLGFGGVPLRGPVSVLNDRMITTIGSAPPRELVYGLVADGNPTVTIRFPDGASKTVRVIDNVYAAWLTSRPSQLTAKNASGQVVSVRVPG